jgi:hypothetical protein
MTMPATAPARHPAPYAFIHIPKTAGSAIRHLLRRTYGPRHCDLKSAKARRHLHPWLNASDLRRARTIYPILAGVCGHRVTPFSGMEKACPGLRYFTFLREPRARFMSNFWHDRRAHGGHAHPRDLAIFCQDPARRNMQTRMLCGQEDARQALAMLRERVSFVGLTEAFDVSLLLFAQWLNDPSFHPRLGVRNRAPLVPPWTLNDQPDLKIMVDEANTEDLVLYREVVETIFPAQIARYAGSLERDLERLHATAHHGRPESSWSAIKRNLLYKPFLHLPE